MKIILADGAGHTFTLGMDAVHQVLLNENATLKAALALAQTTGLEAAAELAAARAKASEDLALIAVQKLQIAKLQRQVFGQRSERSARLIDQLSLTFEELEATAPEDELAVERAAAKTTTVAGFTRKRPERNTFPDHLPRERVVVEAPAVCDRSRPRRRASCNRSLRPSIAR